MDNKDPIQTTTISLELESEIPAQTAQRPQSQAEQFIRMFSSGLYSAGQGLKFIRNMLRCECKITSIDNKQVLIIYGYYPDDNDPGIDVGYGEITDIKSMSDSSIDACLDFVKNLKNAEFLDKVIAYALIHGKWVQGNAIKNFSSIHG